MPETRPIPCGSEAAAPTPGVPTPTVWPPPPTSQPPVPAPRRSVPRAAGVLALACSLSGGLLLVLSAAWWRLPSVVVLDFAVAWLVSLDLHGDGMALLTVGFAVGLFDWRSWSGRLGASLPALFGLGYGLIHGGAFTIVAGAVLVLVMACALPRMSLVGTRRVLSRRWRAVGARTLNEAGGFPGAAVEKAPRPGRR